MAVGGCSIKEASKKKKRGDVRTSPRLCVQRKGRDSNPRYGLRRTNAFQAFQFNHSCTFPVTSAGCCWPSQQEWGANILPNDSATQHSLGLFYGFKLFTGLRLGLGLLRQRSGLRLRLPLFPLGCAFLFWLRLPLHMAGRGGSH